MQLLSIIEPETIFRHVVLITPYFPGCVQLDIANNSYSKSINSMVYLLSILCAEITG
jgi:hypothetical protein